MAQKILLIYPQTGVNNLQPQSPLSLLTLCPGLEDKGFVPIILDTRVERNYRKVIQENIGDAIFVGLTSMTGHQIRYALEVARYVREITPRKKIVWGGIHPSLLPAETIKHPLVDILVKGEGEETVTELAQAILEDGDLREVPGMLLKNEDGTVSDTGDRPLLDLHTLKTPSWHLVDVEKYYEIGVQTGRGCPWRCRFCYNIKYNERKWRSKSGDQIMEELKLLKEKYSVSHVTFYDDNFFSSKKRVEEIARRMIDDNLNIRWSTTCRADYIARFDDEFWQLMKRSGVHILFVGSESGSPAILDYIQKDITLDDIEGMARKTQKLGLRVHTSFMLGFPVEKEEDRKRTFSMMDRIKQIDPNIYITTTCIYTPYPGNEMFEDAQKAGFRPPDNLEDWAHFSFFECQLPWLSPEDQARMENLAFITRFVFWAGEIRERYLRPHYYPAYYFLRLSALLRWKLKFFDYAYEWIIFRKFLEKFMR